MWPGHCTVDTLVERAPDIQINDCGWGTITRRFSAWQWNGDTNGDGNIDAAGNFDFCETYVLVQPGSTDCIAAGDAAIAGVIMTEDTESVAGVEVSLSGANTASMITQDDGAYVFDYLENGQDYSVTPYLNADPLNGVSTFDIILISKHILAVNPLNALSQTERHLETPYMLEVEDIELLADNVYTLTFSVAEEQLPDGFQGTIDLGGLELLSIKKTYEQKGYHTVQLMRAQLAGAAGILTYTLDADGFHASRKMIVIDP